MKHIYIYTEEEDEEGIIITVMPHYVPHQTVKQIDSFQVKDGISSSYSDIKIYKLYLDAAASAPQAMAQHDQISWENSSTCTLQPHEEISTCTSAPPLIMVAYVPEKDVPRVISANNITLKPSEPVAFPQLISHDTFEQNRSEFEPAAN
ncbi:uncharacterized protein LOC111068769 [Drosophila obscura]|uniref:uncharacterized protein LOC111068769 n=1 Tax=Drosophila obscura TaxID=7282 RepID=UPI001BB224A1|nr:uncharacterized protein LOC111068769 [Drosophila obscura]